MVNPITFDAYTGWVDVSDPDNIPPEARAITAADLMRYEKLGGDVAAWSGTVDAAIAGELAPYTPEAQNAVDRAQIADQSAAIARIASAFSRPAGGVSISRSGNDYQLWHGLGGGLFTRYHLNSQTTNPGSYPVNQLARLDAVQAVLDIDHTAAVTTGVWTSAGNAATVGGNYLHSTAAGATMTWTSPASTIVGLTTVAAVNAGCLALVEVDGSTTAADRLQTAQQVVDSGLYASTILVANGGTLNPTDRVYDSYVSSSAGNNFSDRRVLTSGLTYAVHTVKVTNTGYNRIGLASQRVFVTAFNFALNSTRITDANTFPAIDAVLNTTNSAWEYAYNVQPAGTVAAGEMGNVHGNEVQVSLTIRIDGNITTVADLARLDAGSQIVITRVTQMRHTELGSVAVADVTTTYTLDRRGLRVDVSTTWNLQVMVVWAWLMMALNGATPVTGQKFNRAAMLDSATGPVTLPGTNGNSYVLAKTKSVAGWAWSDTGRYAAMMSIPDHTTFLNRWTHAGPNYSQVNDRSGNLTKLYFGRVTASPTREIAAGSVIESSVRYLVSYFPAGAEATLAAL